jgi:hypothetical protein
MFGGSFGGREIRIASKYWEIIADNLSKAGWSFGQEFGDREARKFFLCE